MKRYILPTDHSAAARLDVYGEYYAPYQQHFLKQINLKQDSKVADFGCGPGNTTRGIAGLLGKNGGVVGFDNSSEQVKIAKTRLSEFDTNIDYEVLDVNNIPNKYKNSFDLVYARFLLWNMPSPLDTILSMFSTLKTGGTIACTDIMDIESMVCYPSSRAFSKYKETMISTMISLNMNYKVGTELFGIFKKCNVKVTHQNIIQPVLDTEFKRSNILNTFEQFPFIPGCFSGEREKEKLKEQLAALVEDKSRFITCFRCMQISGIKEN